MPLNNDLIYTVADRNKTKIQKTSNTTRKYTSRKKNNCEPSFKSPINCPSYPIFRKRWNLYLKPLSEDLKSETTSGARHSFFPFFYFPKMYLFIYCFSRWKLVIFCAPIKTIRSIQTTAVASSLYVALPGLLSDVSETKKLARPRE